MQKINVRWTGTPQSFSFVIPTLSQGEQIQTKDIQKEINKQPSLTETISGQVQKERIQRLCSGSSQSGSSLRSITPSNLTKGIQSMNTLLPGHFSSLSNNSTVMISKIKVGFSGTTQQQKLQTAVKKQRLKIGRKTTKKIIVKSVSSIKSQVCTPSPSNPEHLKAREENEFFCSVCNVDCGNIALLQEHKSRKDFICRACTASFVNHSELELHFISHKKYTCELCKKVFYLRKDLHHHKNMVSLCNEKRTRIPCGYCHRTFLHRRNLNQHMKLDHNANPEDNFCHICKTGFKNHSIFVTHLKSVHSAYEGMECGICHQILLGPRRLKYHINTHHIESTESCPICEKILTSKSIKSHMETHDEEEAVCTLCETVMKNKNALKRHLKIHKETPENKTYTCSLCNETFNSLQEKLRHKKKKHTKTPQPVFCDICGKQYKSMQVLKTHLVIHSDDKPFVCDVCGAAFKTKAVLRTHNRIHTEVRKYSCPHCSQGFRWKQTFDKHVTKCESSQANNSLTEPESE